MPSCEAGEHLYGNRGFCIMCKSPEPTSALLVPDWVSDALANISTSTRQRLSFADIHAIGKAARKAPEAELTAANARVTELEALLGEATRPTNSTCGWYDDGGTWASECGVFYTFIEDGPVENDHLFCIKCGKRLLVLDDAGEDR
jgi:hypothetical protein